ncbi:SPOR domain-containing protein [Thiomonas sp. FB-Cd]|uniref:SPOR domain-containing protein n=1 Tax=Thiomonas sp. FB-Cd TaxID=1158292 RepID=UPI0004DFBE8D|nr:SPOR domain-containing protein [Thiomonas sp. FB-Cd]
MTDPLDSIHKRLRWLNRGVLVAGVLVLLGLFIITLRTLQPSKPKTVIVAVAVPKPPQSGTSAPTPASASRPFPAVAASVPATPPALVASRAMTASVSTSAMTPVPGVGASGASRPQGAASAASSGAVAKMQTRPSQAFTSEPTPPSRHISEPVKTHAAGAAQRQAFKAAESGKAIHVAKPAPKHERKRELLTRAKERDVRHHAAAHREVAAVLTCKRSGWYVQVGAFADARRFQRLRARLERASYKPCKAPEAPGGLSVLWVGDYPTRDEAQHAGKRLEASLRSAAYVRHLPPR